MVKIRRYMAPLTRTSGRGNKQKYITIHETANRGRGANANAHARLQAGTNNRNASWHYQVDDREIVQSFDDNVRCWHAGATANNQSIAIEICVNSDGNYQRALDNAAALVAQLRKKYNIPWNRVVSHNFWTGKNCPTIMLSRRGQWDKFIAATNPNSASTVKPASSGSSSSSSGSSTPAPKYERRRTNQDNVPIRTHRNYRDDDNIVGYASTKGYRLNVVEDPPGGYTRVRWEVDGEYGNYWVATEHLDGGKHSTTSSTSTASSSSSSSSGTYPDVALPVTDSHTGASHAAWVYLMRHAVNRTDRNLTINIQRWLRDLGYYKGTVDGLFGPRTVRALQRFLQYKGLYKGVVDGQRGPMTIRAEIAYLNNQRKYLV